MEEFAREVFHMLGNHQSDYTPVKHCNTSSDDELPAETHSTSLTSSIPSFEWVNTEEFNGDEEDHAHALQIIRKCEEELKPFRRSPFGEASLTLAFCKK
jgi:hypothetical protein